MLLHGSDDAESVAGLAATIRLIGLAGATFAVIVHWRWPNRRASLSVANRLGRTPNVLCHRGRHQSLGHGGYAGESKFPLELDVVVVSYTCLIVVCRATAAKSQWEARNSFAILLACRAPEE